MIEWAFRPAASADSEWMAELRAVVMRPDLVRVGVFDPVRVRRRFLDAFVPEHTRVVVAGGSDVGLIAVRPEPDADWIEHFYLDAAHQGRGLGGAVLTAVMDGRDIARPTRLNVLRGSAASRLYARHGFELYEAEGVDEWWEVPARGA